MKYKVHLQQYVERTTTVEVEAVSISEAIKLAKGGAAIDATWADGDDAHGVHAYAVHDAAGAMVWER